MWDTIVLAVLVWGGVVAVGVFGSFLQSQFGKSEEAFDWNKHMGAILMAATVFAVLTFYQGCHQEVFKGV